MIIKIKNLMKSYSDNVIYSNVNLTFVGGNIYGLIGKNGSGKSVFLKNICGFIRPDSGEIIVEGIDIFKNNCFIPNTRVMIERPTFIDNLSGLENLKLLASIQNKIDEKEIIEWLKKVGLDKEKDKKYCKYSLGMKQKLAIVQVLMENPGILILDEPFNGLDKISYNNMIDIFKKEKEKGKLIIIATHIENDINNLCDKVYEIEEGNIAEIQSRKITS